MNNLSEKSASMPLVITISRDHQEYDAKLGGKNKISSSKFIDNYYYFLKLHI